MPDLKEIESKFEEVVEAVTAIRETTESIRGDVDSIDRDKIEKATADGEKALGIVQELQLKLTAKEQTEEKIAERLDAIEKHVAKRGGSGGDDKKAPLSEYGKQFARWLRREPDAISRDSVKDNIVGLCLDGMPYADEKALDKAVALTAKSLVGGSGPDGGVYIPVERSSIMSTRVFETSPMRQNSTVLTTASNAVSVVVDDEEMDAEWGGELTPPKDVDTPQLGEITIPIHHLRARVPITESMLEDSTIDVSGWITNKATDKLGRAENKAFVVGNGNQRPKGFLAYPAAANPDVYERGKIGIVPTLAADPGANFAADDLINLQNHVKEEYQVGAIWMMKRRTFFNVATQKDGQQQYLLRFGDAVAAGLPFQILGKPVSLADDMPAVADQALPVAYGNFPAAYVIIDRLGVTVLIDPYTTDPLVRYRFRKRVGGGLVNFEAIKILLTRTS